MLYSGLPEAGLGGSGEGVDWGRAGSASSGSWRRIVEVEMEAFKGLLWWFRVLRRVFRALERIVIWDAIEELRSVQRFHRNHRQQQRRRRTDSKASS